jgi:single-strand DNA-binding protein
MGLNIVIIQGKLGKDPELRYTPGGDAVCKFSVAVSEKYKDKSGQKKEKVYWARVVAWRKLAEICNQYLVKGQECIIQGKLQDASWEKDGVKHQAVEIMATAMNFSGPAPAKTNEEDIPF